MQSSDKNKKLIFIDFDNVLIDTRAFGKEWLRAFEFCGIDPEIAKESYNQAKITRITYDFNQHLEILQEKYPFLDLLLLEKRLDEARSLSHRFVFKDVADFFEQISDRCISELVTSGAENHQPGKINSSGLVPHFNYVHLVPPGVKKSDAIQARLQHFRRQNFIFMDDLSDNIEDIKSVFPESCAIQILRFEDQVKSEAADACVKNLQDAVPLIDAYGN